MALVTPSQIQGTSLLCDEKVNNLILQVRLVTSSFVVRTQVGAFRHSQEMADNDHWSDEDYDDDDVLDDWENFEAEEEKAKEEAALSAEAKKERDANKAHKKQQRRRKNLVQKEERDATELSAALSAANAELMSRAQNRASAEDLLGNKATKGIESMKTEAEAFGLADETAVVVEKFNEGDDYPHFLVCLSHEISLTMKQQDLAVLRDKLVAVKTEQQRKSKEMNKARKERANQASKDVKAAGDDILDVVDRVGGADSGKAAANQGNSSVPDENSFM